MVGLKHAKIFYAAMEAVAIKLINEGADNYFIGNAQVLRKLEALDYLYKKLKSQYRLDPTWSM